VVETVDILPTILDFIGVDTPEYLQGESLMRLIDGNAVGHKDAVFSQDTINLSRYAVRTNTMKFIMDLRGTRIELYDLIADPEERNNIVRQKPELAKELEEHLVRFVRTNREFGERLESIQDVVLSEEERERLRALGYVD
jgi:arylsulfatase A-like enzyme